MASLEAILKLFSWVWLARLGRTSGFTESIKFAHMKL